MTRSFVFSVHLLIVHFLIYNLFYPHNKAVAYIIKIGLHFVYK